MAKVLLFTFLIFYSNSAYAAIALPTNLSAQDQTEALGILGLATSSKILSSPYPLGGYAGFEFGAGMEFLDVSDIGNLGSKLTNPQTTINYPRFSFGKGFYNDFDVFVHFTPFSENTGISENGGILRWSAFQSAYLPTNISILLHTNSTNIAEKVFTSSFGIDVTAGFTLKFVSLYFGGGQVESRGRFFGFNGGTNEDYRKTSSIHTFMGGVFDFESFFVAAQMDRYEDAIFSVKLGIKR